MHRTLVVLFVLFGGIPCSLADEPAAFTAPQRKLVIEEVLDSPLNWELRNAKEIKPATP